jgi:hypothetical protein
LSPKSEKTVAAGYEDALSSKPVLFSLSRIYKANVFGRKKAQKAQKGKV